MLFECKCILRGTIKYSRTASDFQTPISLIMSIGNPASYAKLAPPRRKGWPA